MNLFDCHVCHPSLNFGILDNVVCCPDRSRLTYTDLCVTILCAVISSYTVCSAILRLRISTRSEAVLSPSATSHCAGLPATP